MTATDAHAATGGGSWARAVLAALGLAAVLAGCGGQLGRAARDITYAATGDAKLAGIAGGAGTALSGLAEIPYDEEVAIGGAVATQVVARYGGRFRSDALERYVNVLGTAVARSSDRPDIPYHFLVLDDAVPNAFAAPGGYVFVTKGLVSTARTEAELAGVIGHEIAHVTQKHTLDVLRRGKVFQGAAEAGAAALEADPKAFGAVVDEALRTIFDRGLDRSKEYEADRLGTEYAARLGYDPSGLRSFLDALGRSSGYRSSTLFKTHPDPADRMAKLAGVLPSYATGYGRATVEKRFRQVKAAAGLARAPAGAATAAVGASPDAAHPSWCVHASGA